MRKIVIPAVLTLWAVFIMAMYCKTYVIPRLVEFIMR